MDFLGVLPDKPCDDSNTVYYLENRHTFKTIVAKVSWQAAGGRALTEQFTMPPDSTEYIGCAAAPAEILEAKFTNF